MTATDRATATDGVTVGAAGTGGQGRGGCRTSPGSRGLTTATDSDAAAVPDPDPDPDTDTVTGTVTDREAATDTVSGTDGVTTRTLVRNPAAGSVQSHGPAVLLRRG